MGETFSLDREKLERLLSVAFEVAEKLALVTSTPKDDLYVKAARAIASQILGLFGAETVFGSEEEQAIINEAAERLGNVLND